jgi:hypothetical protein
MNKKAEGLSMNIIVVAAIALLVLVVIILIFTGRMSIFTQGVNACEPKGSCLTVGECTQQEGTTNYVDRKLICYQDNKKTPDLTKECCMMI